MQMNVLLNLFVRAFNNIWLIVKPTRPRFIPHSLAKTILHPLICTKEADMHLAIALADAVHTSIPAQCVLVRLSAQ